MSSRNAQRLQSVFVSRRDRYALKSASQASIASRFQSPSDARRALEQSEGYAPGALAQPETDQYQLQGLSL